MVWVYLLNCIMIFIGLTKQQLVFVESRTRHFILVFDANLANFSSNGCLEEINIIAVREKISPIKLGLTLTNKCQPFSVILFLIFASKKGILWMTALGCYVLLSSLFTLVLEKRRGGECKSNYFSGMVK